MQCHLSHRFVLRLNCYFNLRITDKLWIQRERPWLNIIIILYFVFDSFAIPTRKLEKLILVWKVDVQCYILIDRIRLRVVCLQDSEKSEKENHRCSIFRSLEMFLFSSTSFAIDFIKMIVLLKLNWIFLIHVSSNFSERSRKNCFCRITQVLAKFLILKMLKTHVYQSSACFLSKLEILFLSSLEKLILKMNEFVCF